MIHKIKHTFQRAALALFLVSILLLSQVVFPTAAQADPPTSPFIESESADYPDASQWPRASYEPISGNVTLQGRTFSAMSTPEIGFGTAALVQSQLPEGFTLQRGTTTHVVIGGSESAMAPNARQAASLPSVGEEIDPEQAELLGTNEQQPTSDKWFIINRLEYQGIPLAKFSDVFTIVGANGEAQYVRKRNLPTEVDATQPTVTSQQAIEVAKQDAGNDLEVSAAKLEIWVNPELKGHLAWTFTLSSPSLTEPVSWRYWVAAVGEPQLLYRENQIFHTHQGTATGTLWPASPLKTPVSERTENRPLDDLTVRRGTDTQLTNQAGLYGFTTGGGNATIQATLSGPNSVVQNQSGANLERSKDGTPNNSIDLNFGAASEDELAQVTAFYWTNLAHDLVQIGLNPNLPELPTRVNINSSCNAFWDGSSINFYRAGGNCPNTAYADVILHEYGHGVDARQGGILNGGYSEGFGDALTILGTRQSCLGRDFLGAGTCLRPATDVILWPPAANEGVHAIGRRYAGFTWELIQQLKKNHSEGEAYDIATTLILAAAAANPSDIPDAVLDSFLADDDDGNLSNGTPHFAELAAAADSRNIPRPAGLVRDKVGYVWAHNPTSASYTPTPVYSYNSAGGAITITRSNTGRYAVRFAGLGGQSTAGGNVQVTAYGFGSEYCKVQSWGSGGDDFVANVNCFAAGGNPADTLYTVLVTWH